MFAYILGAPRIHDQEMAKEERTSTSSDSVDLVLTGLSDVALWILCCILVL